MQLPTRAAPKGDPTIVKHHVSMLPRLAFVAAQTSIVGCLLGRGARISCWCRRNASWERLAREVGMKIGHKSRFKGALQNLRSAQELRPPLGAAPRDAPPVAPPNVGAVGGMSCALLC